MLNLNKN